MKKLLAQLLATATIATCSATAALGQVPIKDRLTLKAAVTPRVAPPSTPQAAFPLSVIPTPAAGVIRFQVPGPDPIEYQVDLNDPDVRKGVIKVYELYSDSFPITESGISYRDSNNVLRPPSFVSFFSRMTNSWSRKGYLVCDFEEDYTGTVNFPNEGIHRHRYIYRLEGRALTIRVIDLDGGLSAARNYNGVFNLTTSGTENPRIIQMQGALSVPLVAFDGPNNDTWYYGNVLDLNQSSATSWFLPEVSQAQITPTSIRYGMHCGNQYLPDSLGRIRAPVNEKMTICVSRNIEDCMIECTQVRSPYGDYLARRTIALLGERTTTWSAYQTLIDLWNDWGIDEVAAYVFDFWTTSGPDTPVGNTIGPDWFPARDPVSFTALASRASALGFQFGAYMAFSGYNPTTGPPQYNITSDFARMANGTVNTSVQFPNLKLFGTAGSAYHSDREHTLASVNYGLSLSYIDIQTYAGPSGGADGNHIDLFDGSPQPKMMRFAIKEQKEWMDRARQVMDGPLLGEGSIGTKPSNLEWLWSGYCDSVQRCINTGAGAESNAVPAGDPLAVTNWQVIPEYELRIVNRRQANHGNGLYTRFLGPSDGPSMVRPNGLPIFPLTDAAHDRYRLYQITYGHTSYLEANGPGDGVGNNVYLPQMIKEYYLMNELARRYLDTPIESIEYFENGTYETFEERYHRTRTTDAFRNPRIRLRYESGLEIHLNHSATNWVVTASNGVVYTLPEDGWVATDINDGFIAFSAITAGTGGSRIDYCLAPGRWEMFDGRGNVGGFGNITTGAPGTLNLMQVRNFVHDRVIHELQQTPTGPGGSLTPSFTIVNGTPPTVTSLELIADRLELRPRYWGGAKAIARYSNGAWRDVSSLVNWVSSSPATVEVDRIGVYRARTSGAASISCTPFGGASATPVVISVQ